MSALQALVFMAVLSVAPAALFVGLLAGLRRRQRTPMMSVYSAHAGVEVSEVTLQDAVRGALGLQADYTERPSNDEYRF
ncbi:hypothetical protein SAMN04487947_1973 [Halogeometricum rufum]|uniref:Uncharacterized protein n=1 Tax=Halogeometricum rufum TaxID=553469 RepID=A0A1I6HET8_9EURY|nr:MULTISPECIES: hypothetical protein [Halogeometricum]MUV58795.1 hypothetical protein [Halogeometricum sp. CBA1124]SFR52888.1 hypothetical protein SAMN04487947_1973 [Halogeometricum rufum]